MNTVNEHVMSSMINREKGHTGSGTDWFSVIVLTVAAIVFVTAELLPVGIIPEISMSFNESIGKVGLMVTGYAWTVAASAVLITAWLAPLERRALLLIITLLFAAANLLVACSASLYWLFFARIIGAFSHGVFWSSVGPLCVRLSNSSSKARITAFVFGGIAIATVIAVPAGTLLAQWLGWRYAFGSIALTSFMIAAAVALRFPVLRSESRSNLHQLPVLLRHPLIRRLCPATALALTGHFCAFTYISPLLEKNIGIAYDHLAVYLFLFGAAGVAGNVLAGMLKDHQLRRAAQGIMAAMATVIILCACIPMYSYLIAALLMIVWGAGICLLTVALQSLILTLPSGLTDAASAMYVTMFNTGIGGGALLGGLLVDHMPTSSVAWTGGAVLLLAAIVIGLPIKSYQPVTILTNTETD